MKSLTASALRAGFVPAFLVVVFIAALPSFASASSIVWGDQSGGTPAQIEITKGGTYAVPLDTPAPAYISVPPEYGAVSGTLFYIDNSSDSPVRQKVATLQIHREEGDVQLAWASAGSYELDIKPVFVPPAGQALNNGFLRWATRLFFADTAEALAVGPGLPPIETIHFTIEGAPEALTPVIIIPGILGSAQHNGEWLIDPITHAYDNLIDTLIAGGYERAVNLFPFPYDWHKSNIDTAVLLKEKIGEVKAACSCGKVDIVAHSMGGLVARQYIQSSFYGHDVRKLIFLGTPQLGAPEDYLMWEGGETNIDIAGRELKYFLLTEALKQGYSNLFDYVRTIPISSVQELLPAYGYIEHIGSEDVPTYPNTEWYPSNSFLENLNSTIGNLYNSGVAIANFVGEIADDTTITTIRVKPPDSISATTPWGYGLPENFGDSSGDQGLERGDGDGTVPLSSASLVINGLQILDSKHNELPTNAEGQVFKELTGNDATAFVENGHGFLETAKNVLIFQILSPADIVVIAPDGKRIGKDFDTGQEINEIPDAFYSGFGTDQEFITIPSPMNGEYKILTQGTGSGGAYTLAVGVVGDAGSNTTFFSGETSPGAITEHDAEVDTEHPGELRIELKSEGAPAETPTESAGTSSGGGGGNGPIVGSFGTTGQVLGAFVSNTEGQVLGTATTSATASPAVAESANPPQSESCVVLVTSIPMARGLPNDPAQVKALQEFLNAELGTEIPLTGIFGPRTEEAVKSFQLKYWREILAPWVPFGLPSDHAATGLVGKTTAWKINTLRCPTLNLQFPTLP